MEQQDLDLRHYLAILWRGKWLILFTTVAALGAALLFARGEQGTAEPSAVYEARATVMIRQGGSLPSLSGVIATVAGSDTSLRTQIELMKSRNVLQRAVARLRSEGDSQEQDSTEQSPEALAAQVELLRSAVEVHPITETSFLEVVATGSSADLAQRRANAVVEAYVDYLKEERTRAVQDALEEVKGQLASVRTPIQIGPQGVDLLPPMGDEVDAILKRLGAVEASLAELSQAERPSVVAPAPLDLTAEAKLMGGTAAEVQSEVKDLSQLRQDLAQRGVSERLTQTADGVADATALLADVTGEMVTLAQAAPSFSTQVTNLRQEVQQTQARLDLAAGDINSLAAEGSLGAGSTTVRLLEDKLRASGFTLTMVAQDLEDLLQEEVAPSVYGRLTALESRLRSTSSQLAALADGLRGLGSSTASTPVVHSLTSIEEWMTEAAESLEEAQLQADLLALKGDSEPLEKEWDALRTKISQAILLLDVVTRQLNAASASTSDPVVAAEVAAQGVRMGSAWDTIRGVSDRLEARPGDSHDGAEAPGELAVVTGRLQAAVSALRRAGTELKQLATRGDDAIPAATLADTENQTRVASVALERVATELARAQGNQANPLVYGQLVVMEESVLKAARDAESVADQLEQLQGGQGPGYQELIRLQQELELARLSPQDIGITIVDSAVTPQMSSSSSSPLPLDMDLRIPLSTAAGFFLGVLAALTREYFDRTIRGRAHLKASLGLAPLGVVPTGKAHGNPHPPLISDRKPPHFSEALRLLAADVTAQWDTAKRIVLITSPTAKAGKTMLAVNLALALAEQGSRVLLVDGNLRKPEIAAVLDLPGDQGLNTALAQGKDPAEHIVQVGAIDVLPGGAPAANPAKIASLPDMSSFLRWAERKYDFVLLDSAPVLGFAETKVVAKQVAGVALVIRNRATTIEAVKATQEELAASSIPLVGTVLNFVSRRECRHLQHDRYGPKVKVKG